MDYAGYVEAYTKHLVAVLAAGLTVLAGLDWVAADVDRVAGRRTRVHEMLEILRLATKNVDVVVVIATTVAVLACCRLGRVDRVAADVDRVTGRRTRVHEMLEILHLATEAVDVVVVRHCL